MTTRMEQRDRKREKDYRKTMIKRRQKLNEREKPETGREEEERETVR